MAAAPGFAGASAAHLLSVLYFLGHQHRYVLASLISFVTSAGELNSPPNIPSLRRDPFALFLDLRSALGHVFTLVHPALHADYTVGGVGLRETKIDVRAKRLQRQAALQVPLFASDFRAIQAAGHAHLDTFATEAQRGVHRFAHRAAKRHALFELQRDGFGNELRIELRAVHFLNVDVHFALGALLHFLFELVDFRALAADDDARTRGVNSHDELIGGALDIDRADARALEALFQLATQLHVFVQQVGVVAVGVPARLPRLVVAEAESIRVCFLSHSLSPRSLPRPNRPAYFLPFLGPPCLPARALRTRRAVPRTPFCASASASIAATRCAAAT